MEDALQDGLQEALRRWQGTRCLGLAGGCRTYRPDAGVAVRRGVCRASALAAVAFSGLQKELDKQGLEILENQQESIATRKQLADLTRGTPPPPPTPSAPRPCLLPWAVFPGLNRDFAPQQTTKRRPKRRRLRRSRRF